MIMFFLVMTQIHVTSILMTSLETKPHHRAIRMLSKGSKAVQTQRRSNVNTTPGRCTEGMRRCINVNYPPGYIIQDICVGLDKTHVSNMIFFFVLLHENILLRLEEALFRGAVNECIQHMFFIK